MNEAILLNLPANKTDLAKLKAGDEVLISGTMYTMRDAGHKRCLKHLEDTGELPFGLDGQTLFYAGPTPAAAGRPLGSIGPTTASRMDFATPQLFEAGISSCIGKGKRDASVADACVEHGCIYFACVGGIAALLASCIVESDVIAWEDLGTEALRKLTVKDLPAFVAIDTQGNDLYRMIEQAQ